MEAIAINGSARKKNDTATLLKNVLAGAKRREAVFPQDCARAYELGAKFAATAKTEI